MTGVETLAVLVLARVHVDRPPDVQSEDVAHAGNVDGVEKLQRKSALSPQPSEDTRFRIAMAIVVIWLVVGASDAWSVRQLA